MVNDCIHGDTAVQVPGWCRKTAGRLLGLTTVLAFCMALSGTAGTAAARPPLFRSFFPLRDPVPSPPLYVAFFPL